MLNNPLIDAVPLWALFPLAFVLILAGHEAGFRLGQPRSGKSRDENESSLGGMVAAELGLLAFLLAFTFGIATSRFDGRRQILLDEANSIGTTYLRAGMLPEAQREPVRKLLMEYVDVRIAAAQGGPLEYGIRRSEELQALLWSEAVAATEKDSRSVPIGLFVQSLNETIDLHTKRVTAGLRSRIPTTVWVVLFAVAILAFGAVGYQGGLARTKRSPAVLVVALTFAAVIWLVADLERPGQGLLQVSQQPMIDLRSSMNLPSR